MPTDRAILCGSVGDGALPFRDDRPLRLRMWGPHRNVHLTIQDVRQAMIKAVPAVFLDLIDIAVYVYCADQAVRRGGDGVEDFGEHWRRNFFFRIPVREPQAWKNQAVLNYLVSTLSFLSEDEYHFEFEQLPNDPTLQRYLEFDSTPYEGIADEVMMFSGGLDSLGGAVQEAITDKRRVLLVNHRSTTKLNRRHRELLSLLREAAGDCRPLHIPVRINKKKYLGCEYTQRSRSFLYAALGATIATMVGLNRLRFYENGVVSMNLPPSPQVVGARATRTTHPQVLNGYSSLLTALAGRRFIVENPFLSRTKTDVLKLIGDAGCGKLIKHSTSCTRTWKRTKQHPHCGVCSQCIDRRFAVLASGQEANDPGDAYEVDLLVGDRVGDEPRTMLASYLETANEIESMDALQFFSRYGEASRVIRHLGGNPNLAAMQVFDLHRRHAKQVTGVVDQAIAKNRSAIRKRELPGSCLLRLVYDSGPSGHENPLIASDAAPAPVRPVNYFCRKGKCWAIRFDGQDERVYTPDIGFHYLQVLFDSPGRPLSASQLDCAIRRATKELRMRVAKPSDLQDVASIPVSDGMEADQVLDREGHENLATRLAEIEKAIPVFQASSSPNRLDELEELENEKTWITSELRKASGIKGRKRQLGGDRNRVRNRVCNAIRRAIAQIRQYDARLSEHLQKPVLNLGHTISYVPRDDLAWANAPG